MKHIKIILSIVLIVIGNRLWGAQATSETSPTLKLMYFTDLLSADEQERSATYYECKKSTELRIKELISIVDMKDIEQENPDALKYAIFLLGMYRSPEAVSSLANHLTFQPEGLMLPSRPVPVQEEYIAVNMLIKIGNTPMTAPVLLNKIAYSSKPLERELAAYVLTKLLGREETVRKIDGAEKLTFNKDRKDRYKSAIEFVKEVNLESVPPVLFGPDGLPVQTKAETNKSDSVKK